MKLLKFIKKHIFVIIIAILITYFTFRQFNIFESYSNTPNSYELEQKIKNDLIPSINTIWKESEEDFKTTVKTLFESLATIGKLGGKTTDDIVKSIEKSGINPDLIIKVMQEQFDLEHEKSHTRMEQKKHDLNKNRAISKELSRRKVVNFNIEQLAKGSKLSDPERINIGLPLEEDGIVTRQLWGYCNDDEDGCRYYMNQQPTCVVTGQTPEGINEYNCQPSYVQNKEAPIFRGTLMSRELLAQVNKQPSTFVEDNNNLVSNEPTQIATSSDIFKL